MEPRFISWDILFSYWCFIWFLVYFVSSFFKNVPVFNFIYENMNPLFLFALALLSSIKNTLLVIVYIQKVNPVLINISKFLFNKCIPLYYLSQQKINVKENIIFSLFLLNLYFIYLFYLRENIFDIYNEIEFQVKTSNHNTSLDSFIKYVKSTSTYQKIEILFSNNLISI